MVCEKVRQKLEKVRSFDTKNKEIYETILSIMEMWELCQLEYFETDPDSYEAIHKIIKSVRLTVDEYKFLSDLIKVIKSKKFYLKTLERLTIQKY